MIVNNLSEDPANCKFIPLRALFFDFEDREQLTKLLLETLARLAVALFDIQHPSSVKHRRTKCIDKKYPFWKSYTKSLADQGHIFLSGPALSKLKAGDTHAPSNDL